ncbi:MAG: YebC/PmpR family DNA-binding transcriptional regulator [Bacteroidota bacterium]
MAGHNKWSKIKRQKAVTDARRSKAWARITRDIMVAARDGGGDPSMNAKLALSVDKAKSENMPKDNIERAIKRGTGEIEGADYVEMTYEGYAPGGIALFIDALTDNTNRTVADIRAILNKAGGSLGQSGSVAFQFNRKGIFDIPAADHDEMELFELVAEAGAEDLVAEDDSFTVTTAVENFGDVQAALNEAGVEVEEASLQQVAITTTVLPPKQAQSVLNVIDKLEEHQDIQAVFSTLDVDEATLAELNA